MFIDNRKRKRELLEVKQFDYPVYQKEIIPEKDKNEIEHRNNTSVEFKSEFKIVKNEEELLYDINKFEIFYSNNTKKGKKKSSTNRYDYIHKIESKKHDFYIQGIVTKPIKSKYYNQLIVAKISEYSLQYGDKAQWSLWIKVADKEWFKLCEPYELYAKYFNPTFYRFKIVMFSTHFIEKDKKNVNYLKLEKYLEKNIKEYKKDDIVYFKDEVFKHVKEFLSLSPNDDSISALDNEINRRIKILKDHPLEGNVTLFSEFKPPPPCNSIDRIQNDVSREVKRINSEIDSYKKRLASNISYEDVDEDRFEITPSDLDLNTKNYMISKLSDVKKIKEYYLGSRKIEGIKAGYPYNYDFDYNYDEDPSINSIVADKLQSKDISNEERDKYLNKRDILEFSRLPKETITYKRYDSLYLDSDSIKQHNFNFEDDPNQDLLPFLVCRVCSMGKHIIGANCDTQQKIDSGMFQSIQDYIIHLEKHRIEILKSISKKERETIDKALMFNSVLNRSKIETLEANALLQLSNDTLGSNNSNSSTSSFRFAWP